MRILFLLLSVMLVAASAEADLCSPAWLRTASGSEARALTRAGADVNERCSANGNRPLHQALLSDRVDPDVIRAMIEAGADTSAENIHGENPVYYAQERFDRARNTLRPGTAPYRREQSLYETMFGAFGDAGSAIADAHGKLCDLNWWRSFPSREARMVGDVLQPEGALRADQDTSAIRSLLQTRGVDPNHVCNFNNDRPLHLLLKLTSFSPYLPGIIHAGVRVLIDAGADPNIRNNSGQSALSLSEIRYDRMADRMIRHAVSWCNRQMTGRQLANEITRNGNDTGAYTYIKNSATGRSYDDVKSEVHMNLYRIDGVSGTIDYRVLCPARGISLEQMGLSPK